jgi:prepilin-type N-terminal cleavage/methylation domain-containing protein/prepilin-type processing-associated H-X9-DG protein
VLSLRYIRTLRLVFVPTRLLPASPDRCRAFTLIELLVVVTIIALLAALLLPVLSVAKAKGQLITCLNNLKQLSLGWQMYTADNSSVLVFNWPMINAMPPPNSNIWVRGSMRNVFDWTNATLIRQGKLFPYASQVPVYHCPADPSQSGGTRHVRSYSMNGWMGSRYMEPSPGYTPFRTFLKENEIAAAGPSTVWVIADEHELTIDDSFFLVTMNDSQPFINLPATRHRRAGNLNFADGHAETFRLHDPNTPDAAPYAGKVYSGVSPTNSDWIRFKRITTSSWDGRYP